LRVESAKAYRLVGPDGHEFPSTTQGTLGGHRRTRVYGRLDCPAALSLIAQGFDVRRHRVFFADERGAVAAAYRPCGACMREEYRSWKSGFHSPEPSWGRSPVQTKMHRAGGDFVRLSD
jgi:hypothetical protein